MTTAALLCIARNEHPFAAEWLEYHVGLGFDRIYYASTDRVFAPIWEFFERSPFRSQVELIHFDDLSPGWQERWYNQQLHSVREQWVLTLDGDEFLYLQDWGSIQEYLHTVPAQVGQIQFPWLNFVSDGYEHERVLDVVRGGRAHVSDHVKSMARVEDLEQLGMHAHRLHAAKTLLSSGLEVAALPRHPWLLRNFETWLEFPLILHVGGRGYMDSLIKIVEQVSHNPKSGPAERQKLRNFLQGDGDWSTMPIRLMLLHLWTALPRAEFEPRLPLLDARTDLVSLRASFRGSMNRLVDFAGSLNSLAGQLEHSFRLKSKLRALNEGDVYDLAEYLKYPSQAAYLEQRRRELKRLTEPRVWPARPSAPSFDRDARWQVKTLELPAVT